MCSLPSGPRYRVNRLSYGRTCYDHLAGHLGVAIADALVAHGAVRRTTQGLTVDPERWDAVAPFGIRCATLAPGQRLRRLDRTPSSSRRCAGRGDRRAGLRAGLGGAARAGGAGRRADHPRQPRAAPVRRPPGRHRGERGGVETLSSAGVPPDGQSFEQHRQVGHRQWGRRLGVADDCRVRCWPRKSRTVSGATGCRFSDLRRFARADTVEELLNRVDVDGLGVAPPPVLVISTFGIGQA
jgi:hypothetical protein